MCHTVNLPGQPRGLDVPGVRDLRFRFPDTDAEVLLPGDDVGWAGPAAIAVTATGAPLPCALASSECSAVGGTLACVDRLFTDDGPACGAVANPVFPAFTALPPANDYQAICTNPASVCTGASNDIRFALDVAGNVLLPMSWRGVLIDRDSVPVARLLRGATTVDSFPGSGQAIRVPGLSFLASYSPEGWKLPPIFDPQVDPTDPVATTFFGTADAPATVLRLARRSSSFSACAGGANDGRPCNAAVECPGGACAAARCVAGPNAGIPCGADADCPASECGTGLFDFSSRTAVPAGPVVVRLGA